MGGGLGTECDRDRLEAGDRTIIIPYRKILIPTDGTAITLTAIKHGLEIARTFNAEVTALSVSSSRSILTPPHRDAGPVTRGAARNAVDSPADRGRELGITVKPTVATGSVAHEIILASAGHDLLVMGTTGRTGFEYLRPGSVAEKTARYARCPVLVVRAPVTIPPEP